MGYSLGSVKLPAMRLLRSLIRTLHKPISYEFYVRTEEITIGVRRANLLKQLGTSIQTRNMMATIDRDGIDYRFLSHQQSGRIKQLNERGMT